MITQDELNADRAAIEAAQAKLAADQAAYDTVQPHLSLIAEAEGYITSLPTEFHDAFLSLLGRMRSML